MHVYETKPHVAHSADEMFALVAKVEDYPKFLPLCEDIKVTHREQRGGKEVLIAGQERLVAGSDGMFRPNDPLTREEMAVMVAQAMEVR